MAKRPSMAQGMHTPYGGWVFRACTGMPVFHQEAQMNFLENILGGGGQQQQDIQNFVQRFEQGPITEGYSDQEALDRYSQVAAPLPPQQYQQAAYQAFNRMSPEERSQFGQYLEQQARQQGVPFPG